MINKKLEKKLGTLFICFIIVCVSLFFAYNFMNTKSNDNNNNTDKNSQEIKKPNNIEHGNDKDKDSNEDPIKEDNNKDAKDNKDNNKDDKKEEEKPIQDPVPVPTELTNADCKKIFNDKHAMVSGDSMAEGLTAYGVLNAENVVWVRGRRIDNMYKDIDKITAYNPNYLFLTYGSNDLEMWTGRVEQFIKKYRETLDYLNEKLPNTKIVINSILPVSEKALQKNSAFGYQELFNTELKKLADERNIPYIDMSLHLFDKEKPFESDGVHPKGFYYPLWAKQMATYLLQN